MRHLGAIGVLFKYFPILGYVTVENLEHGVRRRNQSALLSASSEINIYIFEKIKKGKIKVKKNGLCHNYVQTGIYHPSCAIYEASKTVL